MRAVSFNRLLVGCFLCLIFFFFFTCSLGICFCARRSLHILFLFILLVFFCSSYGNFGFFSQIFRVILLECHGRCVLLLLSFQLSSSRPLSFLLCFWLRESMTIMPEFYTNAECHCVSHSFITLTFLMCISKIIHTRAHTLAHNIYLSIESTSKSPTKIIQ